MFFVVLLHLPKAVVDLSKLFQVLWLATLFVSACGTGFRPPQPFEANDPQILPSETIPTNLSIVPLKKQVDLLDCALPYTSVSIWNTPIDWNSMSIHPSNEQMMDAFFQVIHGLGRIQASMRLIFILLITTHN